MKTHIQIYRRGDNPKNTFYYINVYETDPLGFTYSQAQYMITKEQYIEMKGKKEEKFKDEIYYVIIA